MSSAGRILIMPKGDYNAETEYEMLDLVGHNGKVWLAKKTVVGIEPSINTSEYWMDMIDLTKVNLNDLKILSTEGGRQSMVKGNQFFFSNGRGRLYHSEAPNVATMILQSNDSEDEMDKNASAWDIRRDMPLETRYGLIEWDEDGESIRYGLFGTHNLSLLDSHFQHKANGGSIQITKNFGGKDYIEHTFYLPNANTTKFFANVVGIDSLYVTGICITNYQSDHVTVKFVLNQPVTYDVTLAVGYMY